MPIRSTHASDPAGPARRDDLTGLARVVVAGVVWGTIPLVIRSADGASAVKVFFRVFFAGMTVTLFMAATGRLAEVASLPRRKLAQVAGQGVILTVNWALFLTALDLADVATVELLAYTGPVFVAALAPIVTREPFDRRIFAPLTLALGGVVVILAPHGLALGSGSQLLGAVLAFCSALTYATLLLRSKNILRDISSGALMTVEYTVASLLLAPFVAVAYARGDAPSTPHAYVALISLGLVHTAFAGFLFLGGLRRIRTDHAAILTYAEPVSAVLFAAAFLHEPLTATTLFGGALVVAGGVIVARLKTPSAPEPVPIETAGLDDGDDQRDD